METYVVRVYRHKEAKGDEILGMVEDVEGGDKKPFTTVNEMVQILTGAGLATVGQKKVKKGPAKI